MQVLRFEDLVGEKSGGSQERQIQALGELAELWVMYAIKISLYKYLNSFLVIPGRLGKGRSMLGKTILRRNIKN